MAAAADRALPRARVVDADAVVERRGEGGAWLAAEVSDAARRSVTDVPAGGVSDGPGRLHYRSAAAVFDRLPDARQRIRRRRRAAGCVAPLSQRRPVDGSF